MQIGQRVDGEADERQNNQRLNTEVERPILDDPARGYSHACPSLSRSFDSFRE